MQDLSFQEELVTRRIAKAWRVSKFLPRTIRIIALARKSRMILGAQQLRGKILWNKDLATSPPLFCQIASACDDLPRSLWTSRLHVTWQRLNCEFLGVLRLFLCVPCG